MSQKINSKEVKLRAFVIENKNIKKTDSGLLNLLTDKLVSTKVKDRKMSLNIDDPFHEEDLISDYLIKEHKFIKGAMLRIMDSSEVPNIPDNLFDNDKISIESLESIGVDASKIYKNHYYFLLSSHYIITNLPGNYTITSFQTYINWLLENERADLLFEITPKMVPQKDLPIKDIKNVVVKDPIGNNGQQQSDVSKKKITSLSMEHLKSLIKDVKLISDLEINKVISAELLIKFKKPKGMEEVEYQKIMGAYMKPISDASNIVFHTKKGGSIKGEDVLKIKNVKIELTESGKISEPQLFQEMEMFLTELTNE